MELEIINERVVAWVSQLRVRKSEHQLDNFYICHFENSFGTDSFIFCLNGHLPSFHMHELGAIYINDSGS